MSENTVSTTSTIVIIIYRNHTRGTKKKIKKERKNTASIKRILYPQ